MHKNWTGEYNNRGYNEYWVNIINTLAVWVVLIIFESVKLQKHCLFQYTYAYTIFCINLNKIEILQTDRDKKRDEINTT